MQIRDYTATAQDDGAIQGGQANANDFGGQIGQSEQGLSQQVDNTVDEGVNIEAAKDQVWRANAVSDYQLQQMNAMQQMKTDPNFAQKYGADGSGFTDALKQNLVDGTGQLADQAPSPRSARLLQEQLTQVNTDLLGHAQQFQADQSGAYVKNQVTQMMQTDAKVVEQDPTQASSVLDRGKLNIAQLPYLDPDQKTQLLKDYQQNISLSAGKAMVLHAPEAVMAAIAPDVLGNFKQTPRITAAESTQPVTNFGTANVSQTVQGYSPLITTAAANSGVDPNFLKAQIQAESGGNPTAVNNSDISVTGHPSVGIAQFQPATAAQYGVTNPNDPNQAIPGMAAYMSDLLKQYGGDYKKAAAAYNWGPSNVTQAVATYGDQWFTHAPASTQNYVSKIFDTAAPINTAAQSLQTMQQQQTAAVPSRAPTNPDWFNNLNYEQQYQIIAEAEQGTRANQIRDTQNITLQKAQREQQQQQVMNGFFNRIGAAPDQNPLTVDDIRSADLDYQNKEHLLSAIQSVNKGDMATDPAVFNDLFQRVHLPAGDPNKLADDNALLPYVGHGISMDSLNQLRGEIKGRNTPDGANLADQKKNFFNMAKSQIDGSSFISNDPVGKQKFYDFQSTVLSKIDAEQRAGGDVMEMFQPKSSKYLGKLIPAYARSPQQQIGDYSAYMNNQQTNTPPATQAAAPVPRLPNEGPAEYLARTSNQ